MNTTLIRDPWRRIWRSLSSDLFLAAALSFCTLLFLASILLPQTPQHDPIAYSRWLSETQQRFGATHSLFNTLGLFTVFDSILFRLSLASIGLSCALRLIDQIDLLRARPDRSEPTPVNRPARSIYAAIGFYAGVLIILIGLIIGTFADTRFEQIEVEPEKVTPVNGTAYSLHLDSFSPEFDQANLTLLQQDTTISSGTISLATPAFHQHPAIYLDRIAPALIVSASNAAHNPIGLQRTADSPLQSHNFIGFDYTRMGESFIAAPQANIVLQVWLPGKTQLPDEVQLSDETHIANLIGYGIQAYEIASGKVLTDTNLDIDGSIIISDTTFTFQRTAFVVVSVVNQPSHYFIGLGLLLVFIGLIGSISWPQPRSIWISWAIWLIISLWFSIETFNAYRRLASLELVSPVLIGAWLSISGSLVIDRRARIVPIIISVVALLITLMVDRWLLIHFYRMV